jgi:hypothetical protein
MRDLGYHVLFKCPTNKLVQQYEAANDKTKSNTITMLLILEWERRGSVGILAQAILAQGVMARISASLQFTSQPAVGKSVLGCRHANLSLPAARFLFCLRAAPGRAPWLR